MRVGRHDTPKHLVRPLIRRALEPFVKSGINLELLKIGDPCCGGGIFAAEMADHLYAYHGITNPDKQIYTVDLDPGAVAEAKSKHSWLQIKHADFLFDWPWGPMDIFIGNPPFLGGRKISGVFGNDYRKRITERYPSMRGNADLCAAFFLACADNLDHTAATMGLIATNTISQGQTRKSGLKHMLSEGWEIYDAKTNIPWPGEAKVTVTTVHLSKGFEYAAAPQHTVYERH